MSTNETGKAKICCINNNMWRWPFWAVPTIANSHKGTFNQGAQVEHQKFGLGTVLSSSEERIVIKFDDHGEKKFVTTMVMGSLKKSDRQPPAEKKGSRRKKAVVPAAV